MCNNNIRICCFIGFVCFALFAVAIVCSQVWDLRLSSHCIGRSWNTADSGNREFFVEASEHAHVATATVSAMSSATTVTTITAADRVEDPLVFNIPEVPAEVRGVFHKPTGVVNYTALIEFVKNVSSPTDANPQT